MSNETFLILAVLTTVFVAVGTGGLANATWYWFCVWREPETKNKSLAFALLVEHFPFFLGFLLRLVLTLYVWGIGGVKLENTTPEAVWRGFVTWLIFMVAGIAAGGISRGWFSRPEKGES